jgi:polysaccharide export outer membrane protein
MSWPAVFRVVCVFCAGCAARLESPPSAPGAAEEPFGPAESLVPSGLANDPEQPFALLPGDGLVLHVVSAETTETPGLFVDEQGLVALPLVGAVDVRGLTLPEAGRRIEASLHEYDAFARVWLTVAEPAGHKASVLGAVERPGTLVVHGGMRVADAMAAVGGPKAHDVDGQLFDVADLEAARIVRAPSSVPISVSRALEGDPRHNVRLRPNDLVYLPPARNRGVSILGDVKSPRVVPFASGLRLSMALAIAGGATREADESDVRIVRGRPSAPRVYRAGCQLPIRPPLCSLVGTG